MIPSSCSLVAACVVACSAVTVAGCVPIPTDAATPSAATVRTPAANPPATAVNSQVGSLGPRPDVPGPPVFLPPTPAGFLAANDVNVWLLERHEDPIVSCAITVPSGSASDPADKGGVAYATAKMLLRGAGTRGAIDLGRAIDDLGARVQTTVTPDASFLTLTVLTHNLVPALTLVGDIVGHPRLDADEFRRFAALWQDALHARDEDPDATARVVSSLAFFGRGHPYGHPPDGTTTSARNVALEDVRRFYGSAWRPDRAVVVCAGDTTRVELGLRIDRTLGAWQASSTPPPATLAPLAPPTPHPKVVFVDRPDAPQVVIAVVGQGPPVLDPGEPALWRVNDAIGGRFASRLNQDLRERLCVTYGAQSSYTRSRGPGLVIAKSDVVTAKTVDALRAILSELRGFAHDGLTEAEVSRTRASARGSLVGEYESVESMVSKLAGDAALGLGRDRERVAAALRDSATAAELNALAGRYYDPDRAMIVTVGPRDVVLPALIAAGLPAPLQLDAEGREVP